MEPSNIFGGAEECHSSESGWTMYIGDAAADDDGDAGTDADHDDDDDDDGDRFDGADESQTDANHEAETDDSMASDASSGPSHRLEQEVEGEEEGRHCYSDKKARKSSVGSKQKPGTEKKEDKEEMRRLKTKESSTQSPSGSRKNIWFGKRK
ncbi:hypothetical protein ES288_A03G093800v1 [Gossypium darwinii]|uniref:Uncharacterized protein n=1 Tax=Gossypium darwinii TaxID=34276 RepID=A0A5D2H1X2_GOSDA|nr:hypothetical protein ES288_A03G093800v1 [Gossypium darwinii]